MLKRSFTDELSSEDYLEHIAANRFVYVDNDPIMFADPDGLFKACVTKQINPNARAMPFPGGGVRCGCALLGTCVPGRTIVTTFIPKPAGAPCPKYCTRLVKGTKVPWFGPWNCVY